MKVPRVLLLSGTAPGSTGIGEIFLRNLCLSYPHDSICAFGLTAARPPVSEDLRWMPIEFSGVPRNGPLQILQRLGDLSKGVRSAIDFGRKHEVEVVWAVLHSPTVIKAARKVAAGLGARLIPTVWDPPQRLLSERGAGRLTTRLVMAEFEKTLSRGEKCGVASDGMAEEYKRLYGIDPVVLICGASSQLRHAPPTAPSENDEFVIGFAGSIYTHKEWTALLSALASVDWKIEGRKVRLRVAASQAIFQPAQNSKMHIEYLGWRSVEETVEIMSQTDVTYLPYWFDASQALNVRLCFPNKTSTYLAAGRPIFFHGPKDSSPARFFQRYPVAQCCHSMERDEILKTIRRFMVDKDFWARAAIANQAALNEELDLSVFRERFADLIGISKECLEPVV